MLKKIISLMSPSFNFLCEEGCEPQWMLRDVGTTDSLDVLNVGFSFQQINDYHLNIPVPSINGSVDQISDLVKMEESCLDWAIEKNLYRKDDRTTLKNTVVTGLCIKAYPNLELAVYPRLIQHIMALFSIDDGLDEDKKFEIKYHQRNFYYDLRLREFIDYSVFDEGINNFGEWDREFSPNPLVDTIVDIVEYIRQKYPDSALSLNRQIVKSLFEDYLKHVEIEKDNIENKKEYTEEELDGIRPYTSGAVYAIKLGALIQGVDLGSFSKEWLDIYNEKVLSASKCVMWGNDIVSASKERDPNNRSITNNVLLHEQKFPKDDAYQYVIERYNREIGLCLDMPLPEPSDANGIVDSVIEGWIGQLIWAFCVPRYNKGVSNEYLYNLWNFIGWLRHNALS